MIPHPIFSPKRLLRPAFAATVSTLTLILLLSSIWQPRVEAVPTITIFPEPSKAVCGSAQNVTFSIVDVTAPTNATLTAVPEGTMVTLTTNLGTITSPVRTRNGQAIAALQFGPRDSGNAAVHITASGASADKTIAVTCARPAAAPATRPPAAVIQPPAAPISAPSGGALPPPAPAPAATAPSAQAVSVTEFSYAPVSFFVHAGQPSSINVSNVGRVNHTFTIDGVTDSGIIAPGSSRTIQLSSQPAGTLTFYCTIHGRSVMSGQITVGQ